MTKKAMTGFDCVFLHETQQTELAREQVEFGAIFARLACGNSRAAPFAGFPPFLPIWGDEGPCGPIDLDPPEAIDGWIVRRVREDGKGRKYATKGVIPGWPEAPGEQCFLIGFAGERAETVLAADRNQGRQPIRANARYRATLSLGTIANGDLAPTLTWNVGAPRWEKKNSR